MYYRINKTALLLMVPVTYTTYTQLMSLRCRLLTYGAASIARSLDPRLVLAKLMTPKLTVLSPNYLRLRPLGHAVVMDRS